MSAVQAELKMNEKSYDTFDNDQKLIRKSRSNVDILRIFLFLGLLTITIIFGAYMLRSYWTQSVEICVEKKGSSVYLPFLGQRAQVSLENTKPGSNEKPNIFVFLADDFGKHFDFKISANSRVHRGTVRFPDPTFYPVENSNSSIKK